MQNVSLQPNVEALQAQQGAQQIADTSLFANQNANLEATPQADTLELSTQEQPKKSKKGLLIKLGVAVAAAAAVGIGIKTGKIKNPFKKNDIVKVADDVEDIAEKGKEAAKDIVNKGKGAAEDVANKGEEIVKMATPEKPQVYKVLGKRIKSYQNEGKKVISKNAYKENLKMIKQLDSKVVKRMSDDTLKTLLFNTPCQIKQESLDVIKKFTPEQMTNIMNNELGPESLTNLLLGRFNLSSDFADLTKCLERFAK